MDNLLNDVVRDNESRRSRLKLLRGAFAVLPIFIGALLFWQWSGMTHQAAPPMEEFYATDIPAADAELDAFIQSTQASALTTHSERDYQRLAQALERRYRRTHAAADLNAAAEAHARAANIQRRAKSPMPIGFSFTLIVAIPVMVAAILLLALSNQLLHTQESVDHAWGQIEVCRQRRSDLIPLLTRVVDASAKHEHGLQVDVTTLRRAQPPGGNEDDGSAIKNVITQLEKYPDVRASDNFRQLQSQFETSENLFFGARKRLNDAVARHNQLLVKFPWNVSAAIFDIRPRDYFMATGEPHE